MSSISFSQILNLKTRHKGGEPGLLSIQLLASSRKWKEARIFTLEILSNSLNHISTYSLKSDKTQGQGRGMTLHCNTLIL